MRKILDKIVDIFTRIDIFFTPKCDQCGEKSKEKSKELVVWEHYLEAGYLICPKCAKKKQEEQKTVKKMEDFTLKYQKDYYF